MARGNQRDKAREKTQKAAASAASLVATQSLGDCVLDEQMLTVITEA